MTRRGDWFERDFRRDRNDDPGIEGSLHGSQPVEPRGRTPREKPSSHRHRDPQPHEDHGPSHDAGGADENPHTVDTANPHGVTAPQAGAVENAVGAPSLRRETRAAQPAASNVAVGTRSVIEDEANVEEVAADTTGDGAADTWVVVGTDPVHDHDDVYVNDTGDTMTGTLTQDEVSNMVRSLRVVDGTNTDEWRLHHGSSGGRGAGLLRLFHGGVEVNSVVARADEWEFRNKVRSVGNVESDGRLVVTSGDGSHLDAYMIADRRAIFRLFDADGTNSWFDLRRDITGSRFRVFNANVLVDQALTVGGRADVGGMDSGGSLRVDLGGVGETRVSHGGGTNNRGYFVVEDDAGNTATLVVYGPGDDVSAPGFVFSHEVLISHGDLTLDGGDLIANKSSHGGNIIVQGWIDADESIVADTYMRAINKMGVNSSGSATDPALRIDSSTSLGGISVVGFYRSQSSAGDNRLVVAGDGATIAVFDPGGAKFVHPNSDASANLGASNIRWDYVYCYTLDQASDPTLKTDMQPISADEAARRVRDTSDAAIGFRWRDGGTQIHLGFDAEKVREAHRGESGAAATPADYSDRTAEPVEGEPQGPPTSIRPFEMIADLYVTVAALLDRVEQLEAT